MPELPEVEGLRRALEARVKGLTIVSVAVRAPEIIGHPTAETFCLGCAGQSIAAVERRGKFLKLMLSGGQLVIHLRMTGWLWVKPADAPLEKHAHAILCLSDGWELRYSDARRFGRLCLVPNGERDVYSGVDRLGLEPFDEDFDAEYLKRRMGTSGRAIKTCLLDQRIVAGVGNIYSDEILFSARLHPARPANGLNGEEWARLARAIPEVLADFVGKRDAARAEYLQDGGQNVHDVPALRAYGRAGLPCARCGTAIQRMVLSGRSSAFCPHCQRLDPCARANRAPERR